MKKPFLLLISSLFFCTPCLSQGKPNKHFLSYLMRHDHEHFQNILNNKDEWEVQIIYTQINRHANNQPTFKSFYFNVDSSKYFYPASTVKLPMVLLAFEKLDQLNIKGLNKHTLMLSDSVYSGQRFARTDTTSEGGIPSISHYAKKILLVSDNDAFNRLYEFVGQKETNKALHNKGYNMRILHRLERPLTPDQNRHTEAIRFTRNDTLIYSQPMLVNNDSIRPFRHVTKGMGYIKKDSLINEPFDFTYKNFYPLREQQEILKAILFPDRVKPARRFNITEADRKFVMQYMSQLPRETTWPHYDQDSTYRDSYCKFLMYGEDQDSIPPNIRIFNKVGDAYGYLIDNAYIVDFDLGVEFMLSAVINTNIDGIYNDGIYEYKKIGYPFMKDLGQLIYQYERKRKRTHKPDLSDFRLKYDK